MPGGLQASEGSLDPGYRTTGGSLEVRRLGLAARLADCGVDLSACGEAWEHLEVGLVGGREVCRFVKLATKPPYPSPTSRRPQASPQALRPTPQSFSRSASK